MESGCHSTGFCFLLAPSGFAFLPIISYFRLAITVYFLWFTIWNGRTKKSWLDIKI